MLKNFSAADSWNLQMKILTLTATRDELLNLKSELLIWGLFFTLLAGIGRAWDNATAPLVMRSGLPSVAYIFILAAFLFVFISPLRPKSWSYRRLLILISMTAMPGLLYAIPLEMMLSPEKAAAGNALLLFIVATWRVVILASFLIKTTGMNWSHLTVALLLPLFVIINCLISLEKFEKTFGAMGGIRRYIRISDETAFRQWKKREDAERKRAAAKGETYYSEFATPIPYESPDGKTRERIFELSSFRENEPIPPGLKEIPWDDPNYFPPGPIMFFIRPLGLVSWYAAPLLGIYYAGAVVYGINLFFKNRRIKSPTADDAQE